MKKTMFLAIMLLLAGCADRTVSTSVTARDGQDGRDGTSTICSVSQAEGGVVLSCSDGSSGFIANGTNGTDGTDGSDGQNGTNGTNGVNGSGSLSTIALNGCTLAATGIYAKLQGQGSLKLYTNSNCSGNSLASLSSTDELYILTGGDLLLFQSSANILYKLDFN